MSNHPVGCLELLETFSLLASCAGDMADIHCPGAQPIDREAFVRRTRVKWPLLFGAVDVFSCRGGMFSVLRYYEPTRCVVQE